MLDLQAVSIPKYSKNVDTAKAFLLFLNSPELWNPLAKDGFAFFIPLLKAYQDKPDMPWNGDPRLSTFKVKFENGRPLNYPSKPNNKANDVLINFVLVDMFARVCAGKATAEESVKHATKQLQDIWSAS